MSDTTERTRTRTREVVETKTVEDEDYYCPLCEQWYDDDEIVLLSVGPVKENEDAIEFTWKNTKHDQLCQHCCDRLFDYDGYTGIPDEISYEVDHWTWREMLSGAVSIALPLGALGFVFYGFGTLLGAFFNSMDSIATNPEASEFAQASGSIVGTFVELFPLFVVVTLLIMIGSSVGPRRI